jgi:hypothetical protein
MQKTAAIHCRIIADRTFLSQIGRYLLTSFPARDYLDEQLKVCEVSPINGGLLCVVSQGT